jgi:YbgC/YbaW family acyl-CoA thioester hydrolase
MSDHSKLPGRVPGKTRFESELQVRPDDIDMNQHVHASRYFDYVLAARYDQMARCYKMPMEDFIKIGFGWYVRTMHIEYKRPLGIGEWFIVRTWVEEITRDSVKVEFEILKKSNGKLASNGHGIYTMVSLATGRAEEIPVWIADKYSV